MSMNNMIHTRLTEEQMEQYTSRKHEDRNTVQLSKKSNIPTSSIQQEYLENASIERHETTIDHTLGQSLVLEFGINVEATDEVEVKTEQETRIRNIPEGAIFSKYIDNYNGHEYICKICDASFDYFDEFLVHKNLIHAIKPYVCNLCDARFILMAHLNEHRNKRDNNSCMRNSSVSLAETQTSLETKSLNHHDITVLKSSFKLQQCNLCFKSFKTHSELSGHLKGHTDSNEITSRRQLTLNKKKVKNENENSRQSEEHVFPNIGKLSRSQKCDDCDRYFTTHRQLNIHSKQHKQQMMCNMCHKTFVLKQSFEKHLLSHTNVTISNGISNSTFKKQKDVVGSVKHKSNSVNKQIKIIKITDDKREKQTISLNKTMFQCLHCNKNCKSMKSLVQHNRWHHSSTQLSNRKLKSETVECNWCSIVITKKNLLRHIKNIHTNINPIKCLHCPMVFKDYVSLKLHKDKCHILSLILDLHAFKF